LTTMTCAIFSPDRQMAISGNTPAHVRVSRTMRAEDSSSGQSCRFLRGLSRLPFLFSAVNHGLRHAHDLLRKCEETVGFAFRFFGFGHKNLGSAFEGVDDSKEKTNPISPLSPLGALV